MKRERSSWLLILAVGMWAAMGCNEPQHASDGDVEASKAGRELTSVKVAQSVAAGAYHSLFLRRDGSVWAWGQNVAGQLGTGSTSTTLVPQPSQVSGLPAIKAVAAGIAHSLALDVSGNVWAWGQNAYGQAGMGTAGGVVLVPARVMALSNIQAIAANGNFSLALGEDGRLWAWGQNTSGQVGTGITSPSVAPPVVVPGLPTVRSMAAGVNHVLALDADGQVWAWGLNSSAQVGTGAASASVLAPVHVTGLPRATAVAAGAGHSLIVDEQFGNVWAWGQNAFGQVGTGSPTSTPVVSPTPVSGVFAVTALVAGHNSSLVIVGNGLAMAWGHNASGQLGIGTTTNSASPVNVAGVADAKALAAGAGHALALRPGCPVWTWGHNGQGQLGTGSTSATPVTAPGAALLVNTFYFDGDMDGFGDEFLTEQACEPSPGFVQELDCDDYAATTYPGAQESCNGVDDDCDSAVDDGNPGGGDSCSTGQPGVCVAGMTACTQGSVVCQPRQAASAEQCDGLDNDCDGTADEGNPGGLQACATGLLGVCSEGATHCSHGALECVPTRGASSEVCDGQDNDCNGQADDGLTCATSGWAPTGSLATGRYDHTATQLPSGKVLVTGGSNSSGQLKTAELYDPATGTWASTADLQIPRRSHAATLLTSGRVLVTGGWVEGEGVAATEVYDPETATWSDAGWRPTARWYHTATRLASGKVLVAGGEYFDGPLGDAEIYEPVTGSWSPTGGAGLGVGYYRTATLLLSGKVLIAGGTSGGSEHLDSASLYDPVYAEWTSAGYLSAARLGHTATLLRSGKVLIVGGLSNRDTLGTAEVYDPVTGSWAPTGHLATGRFFHTATLLPSGKVLVVGGRNRSGARYNTAEVYDPVTGVWSSAGSLAMSRYQHTATLLPSGKVLIVGGWAGGATSTAELYTP